MLGRNTALLVGACFEFGRRMSAALGQGCELNGRLAARTAIETLGAMANEADGGELRLREQCLQSIDVRLRWLGTLCAAIKHTDPTRVLRLNNERARLMTLRAVVPHAYPTQLRFVLGQVCVDDGRVDYMGLTIEDLIAAVLGEQAPAANATSASGEIHVEPAGTVADPCKECRERGSCEGHAAAGGETPA